MFQRYTEKARRVIFFARYEASQFGSPYIETEHLLLGLLREDKALTNRFLRSHASVESIRNQVEAHSTIREKVSTSVDLPLSNECKSVLAYAAEEADRLSDKHIGTEHLLLGLLRTVKCFAAELLNERGLKITHVREELARMPVEHSVGSPSEATPVGELFRDLTQAAMDGELNPMVGRDQELDAVVEVLCDRDKKNPVVVGEFGVGKTALVEGLAQRIANGAAPSQLAEKRILALEPRVLAIWMRDRQRFADRLNQIDQSLVNPEVIVLVDEFHAMWAASSTPGLKDLGDLLKPALMQGRMQCIGIATPGNYRNLVDMAPWIERCFRAVHVRPMDEQNALRVLQARKGQLEKFHEVVYSDEALDCAAHCACRYLADRPLPGKALDLLDAAGARVKLRQPALPLEIVESMKRLRVITTRMDAAIQNHEFEKARFISEEARTETENLKALRVKHPLAYSASSTVSREDIEEVISRRTAYPFVP